MKPEQIEQCRLFDWIRSRPDIEPFAMHIANERETSAIEGSLLKRMGVKRGVSDVFIAIPKGEYHGFWLELKAGKGKPTDFQKKFMATMTTQGYMSVCVTGYESARLVIEQYMAL